MRMNWRVGVGLMTPLFLGVAPIFGKLAINAGADSFTVAAWRTLIAVVLLWVWVRRAVTRRARMRTRHRRHRPRARRRWCRSSMSEML